MGVVVDGGGSGGNGVVGLKLVFVGLVLSGWWLCGGGCGWGWCLSVREQRTMWVVVDGGGSGGNGAVGLTLVFVQESEI
jgi:hypothetical protein